MNWAWATSLDQIWRMPAFPMWLALAAAAFFALIALVTLLRAEKSVANGALMMITLLAVGIAVAATFRDFSLGGPDASAGLQSAAPPQRQMASVPALSCVDDIAGEAVLAACEKALFGSPENVAAALSYAASQIARLTALGDVAAANRSLTPEVQMLRHAVEHDRYGLMAYVLQARDHCTPADCAVFRSLTDRRQIAANMDARAYDGLVARYTLLWNSPPTTAAATTTPATSVPLAALGSSMPTGRPTNADFPSAASIPPVSIMTPEPGTTPPAPHPPATSSQASAPVPPTHPAATPAPAAAKKQAASKSSHAAAPVQLAPAAPDPAVAND